MQWGSLKFLHKILRWGGGVDWDSSSQIPNGVAVICKNSRWRAESVATRYGRSHTMSTDGGSQTIGITGVDCLNVLVDNPGQLPIAFSDIGNLYLEQPAGSGSLLPQATPFSLPRGAYMRDALAYNRIYMAFSNMLAALSPPLVLDGPSQTFSPLGQTTVGALWAADTYYQIGDLVRATDGRWWRCTHAGGGPSGNTPPPWPQFNGYFVGTVWTPATAVDLIGGSFWEEWTPACAQYLPTPSIAGAIVTHNPGGGTIASGQDVYVKLAYFGMTSNFNGPRSAPLVFKNTSANDAITIGAGNGAGGIVGGVPMLRWIAEICLQPNLFPYINANGPFLQWNVYVAAVATGDAAPADSDYALITSLTYPLYPVNQPVVITAIPSAFVDNQAPVRFWYSPTYFAAPVDEPPLTPFIGEGGTRYMIVLRENLNDSLCPVDPGSPIPVNLVGEVQIEIISIVRDAGGNVTATVGDVTGIAPGQEIIVGGVTTVTTFNGSRNVSNVQTTLAPEGIIQWNDGVMTAANDNTGGITLPAGPAPVAFLPPGGPYTQQTIAAFTVAAPQDGQPIQLQAGPFTYIPESDPTANFETPILSMTGGLTLVLTISSLQRYAGGQVSCAVDNIAGVQVGMTAIIAAQGDASFNGSYEIQAIVPGTGTAGTLQWTQTDIATGGPGGSGSIVTIGTSLGQIQATLQSAVGLAAGNVVNIQGASPDSFNGPQTLASVLGSVVTFPSLATGTADVSGATMTLLQDLPTTSCAIKSAIISITRDYAGNVTAQIADIEGWAAGQVAAIATVADATFDGNFELTSANLNADGITASVSWVQTGQPQANSVGGTISSVPDLQVNFDVNFLSNGTDVTAQLTSIIPPPCVDIFYSQNLDRMFYTKGTDTQHYVSNQGDAENIDSVGGLLSVAANNGAVTVCVRELQSGEILSLKENGGFAIQPNALTPDQWGLDDRWDKHGPVNAAAVAVGPDFLVFFCEYTGPYRYYKGELTWIGQEKQGTWDRVNWAAKNTIWCEIDDDNKTLHIGLPLDGATTPNKDIKLNYFNGWQDPLIVNMMGEVIPNRYGRRWSEDDLLALCGKLVKRSLNPPMNNRINDRQMLYGLADVAGQNVGHVDMDVPDTYDDNGAGIDWQYQPACAQTPTLDLIRVVEYKFRASGSGTLFLQPVTDDPSYQVDPKEQVLTPGKPTKGAGSMKIDGDNEMVTLLLTNGAQPDTWVQMEALMLGGTETYPARQNSEQS